MRIRYSSGGPPVKSVREPERMLTAHELEALRRVGMALGRCTRRRAKRARQESQSVLLGLFRTALPEAEAATMLGTSVSRIRRRIEERTLLALSNGAEWRLPSIQFDSGRELPGLSVVLPALPEGTSVLETIVWLVTPNVDLADADISDESQGSISPRDYLLRTNDGGRVAELACSLRVD